MTSIALPETRQGSVKDKLTSYFTDLSAFFEKSASQYVKELGQSDFENGSYIISEPGIYKLTEDIVFEPRSDSGMLPDSFGDSSSPEFLGFFRAIGVVADDVIIDLNGHRIDMSERFAHRQTVYAHIELNDRPFGGGDDAGFTTFSGEGATVLRDANRVMVKNGTLGRSAHHGIHGNVNEDILYQNVTFEKYELFASSMNKSSRVAVVDCTARNTSQTVTFMGEWTSVLTFVQPLRRIVQDGGVNNYTPQQKRQASRYLYALETIIEEVLRPSMFDASSGHILTNAKTFHAEVTYPAELGGGTEDIDLTNVLSRFSLPTGSVGGGFMFNRTQDVGDFADENAQTDGDVTHGVHLENVTVDGVALDTREVLGVEYRNGKDGEWTLLRSARFNVFDFLHLTGHGTKDYRGGRYVPSYFNDLQLWLARNTRGLGANQAVPQSILDWAGDDETASQRSIEEQVRRHSETLRFRTNIDFMGHTTKGAVGIRLDGVRGATLRNVTVRDMVNHGAARAAASTKQDGRDNIAPQRYEGSNVRGISIAYSDRVTASGVDISDLRSDHGSVFGYNVFNGSGRATLERGSVRDLQAGAGMSLASSALVVPTTVLPLAVGVMDEGASSFTVRDVQCSELSSPAGAQFEASYWTNSKKQSVAETVNNGDGASAPDSAKNTGSGGCPFGFDARKSGCPAERARSIAKRKSHYRNRIGC